MRKEKDSALPILKPVGGSRRWSENLRGGGIKKNELQSSADGRCAIVAVLVFLAMVVGFLMWRCIRLERRLALVESPPEYETSEKVNLPQVEKPRTYTTAPWLGEKNSFPEGAYCDLLDPDPTKVFDPYGGAMLAR